MNGWRSRLAMIAAIWIAFQAHASFAPYLPNSPAGMLAFHGSAALADLALIYCAPTFLSGPICDETQTLCLISIVANFIGWLLYLAYFSPVYFDLFMWVLGYVQSLRLLIVDSDDANHLGVHLVRGPNFLGA